MDTVFLLHHIHELEDDAEFVKLIGIYRTRKAAEAARRQLIGKPGFCDKPRGFHIEGYGLGEDHWTEGYIGDDK